MPDINANICDPKCDAVWVGLVLPWVSLRRIAFCLWLILGFLRHALEKRPKKGVTAGEAGLGYEGTRKWPAFRSLSICKPDDRELATSQRLPRPSRWQTALPAGHSQRFMPWSVAESSFSSFFSLHGKKSFACSSRGGGRARDFNNLENKIPKRLTNKLTRKRRKKVSDQSRKTSVDSGFVQ